MPTKDEIPELETISKESDHLFKMINNGSHMACVLIAGSYLDKCLAAMLKRRLAKCKETNELLTPNGSLGTFSARITMAFVLGLITKITHDNLNVVRKIRNHFAHHHLDMTFADPGVQSLCHGLQLPKTSLPSLSDEEREKNIDEQIDHAEKVQGEKATAVERKEIKQREKARWEFVRCVVNLQSIILLDGLSLSHAEIKTKGIPLW